MSHDAWFLRLREACGALRRPGCEDGPLGCAGVGYCAACFEKARTRKARRKK